MRNGLDLVLATFAPTAARAARPVTAADSFPKQWEYVTSKAKFNAVCCGRQSGKTFGATLAAEMVLSRPGTRVIYATLIRRNAKKLFWWPLLEGMAKRGWTVKDLDDKNESDLMLWLPNGSFLQALSCSEMADLETIRGDQSDLFLIDECQSPRDDVLGALVTKIVPPMLMKRGGRCDLIGTVPEVEPSTFSIRLDDPHWRSFGWDCFSNPHMDAEQVRRTCEEAGIGPGHVIYEREILGKRVRDPSKMAYEYERGRNDYDPASVDFAGDTWRHSVGLDLGFSDHDAIVVHGWRRDDGGRHLYVRFAWQHRHLDVDDLGDVLALVVEVYRPGTIVGDHGGHGAVKVLETLKHRLRIAMQLKPADVMVSVGLVNDDYRTGRLLHPTADAETQMLLAALEARDWHDNRKARIRALLRTSADLSAEIGRVTISENDTTKKREINKRGFHSDLTEANRYAHHAARHYAAKEARPAKSMDQLRQERSSWRRRMQQDPFNPRNTAWRA